MATERESMKKILLALHAIHPDVINYFIIENKIIDHNKDAIKNYKSPTDRTIKNSFNRSNGLSPNTFAFFCSYVPNPGLDCTYECLSTGLRKSIVDGWRGGGDVSSAFSAALAKIIANPSVDHSLVLNDSNYIGHLQDQHLPFHESTKQKYFFNKIKCSIERVTGIKLPSVCINGDPVFDCSFIDAPGVERPVVEVSCTLNGPATPPDASVSEFASKAKSGPHAHDNPSFGVSGYTTNKGRLLINVCWTTYFRSLEIHDAHYMQAIYSCGTDVEDRKIDALSKNIARVLRDKGNCSHPILGVTTAVVFKRQSDGPYWTFVQLKEGGASRIPESHLTPSFVHQPATKMKRSLLREVADIEFHIYRELLEEIFNFPENIHSDFDFYKQIVNRHFAIKSINGLIEKKQAELFCHGLVLDAHRAKFELVYVLRIDDPIWFAEIGQHIEANQEAIKGGVVLAPLDAEGVVQTLAGQLTHSKPVRRMCSPGQAGLVAAIEHLKNRQDPHLKTVSIS